MNEGTGLELAAKRPWNVVYLGRCDVRYDLLTTLVKKGPIIQLDLVNLKWVDR